jgi:hypothetical protein
VESGVLKLITARLDLNSREDPGRHSDHLPSGFVATKYWDTFKRPDQRSN